ncbi:MAG: hypothetical protein OXR66_09450 [Candidatus Woesearchaeota archaeon]|nr:hypothetical protein [Candidatus Woesearchaeota archaeon]
MSLYETVNDAIDLLSHAAAGEVTISRETREVLNASGQVNQHYTAVMRAYNAAVHQHPLGTQALWFLLNMTSPRTTRAISRRIPHLLNSRRTKFP